MAKTTNKEPYSLRLDSGIIGHISKEADDLNKRSSADLMDTILMAYFSMPRQQRIDFLNKAYNYDGKRK